MARRTWIIVLFFVVNWFAHFFYAPALGLYEDDYAHIAPWLGANPADLVQNLVNNWITWPQGRPLGFSLPNVFGFVGFQLGGLAGVYLIGAIILTLNSFLFYLIIRHLAPDTVAILGGVAFCLFPADTTRSFLMHATGLQPSLTFLLIAILFYMSGRNKSSYLIILGSLLTYESGFVAFFGAPLLKTRLDRRIVRESVAHFAVLGAIALVDFILRKVLGDPRVDLGGRAIFVPFKALGGMTIGPAVSMIQWLFAPARTLMSLDLGIVVVMIACFGLFLWVLSKKKVDLPGNEAISSEALKSRLLTWRISPQVAEYCARTITLPFAGIVFLVLAYGFSFTHFPPTAQYGRGTSVHLAAALGGSFLFAWALSVLIIAANSHARFGWAAGAIALYFAILVGYGLVIQKDLALSWQYQRSFWTNLLETFPDVTEGTMILVARSGLPETQYILTHSWSDPIILGQILRPPSGWKKEPRLFVVKDNWMSGVIIDRGQLAWADPEIDWLTNQVILPDGNLILLNSTDGKLTRTYGSININGSTLRLKPKPETNPQYAHTVLFGLLIDETQVHIP